MRRIVFYYTALIHLTLLCTQTGAAQADYFPAIVSLGGTGFLSTATIYPNSSGAVGFRVEARRKSAFGFATGLQVIASGDVGAGVPLLLELNTDNPQVNLKVSGGAYAQVGAGQPFFFPTAEVRLRFGNRDKSRILFDLIAGAYFYYRYDCPRSNFTCQGGFYRVGWDTQPGLGFALCYVIRKKAARDSDYPIRTISIHPVKKQ